MPDTSTPNPAPIPIKNSFSGMYLVFPNPGIHSLVATTFKFRRQLTVRTELKQASGWGNELNVFLMQGLNELRTHTNRITYNSANVTQNKIGNDASDPKNVNLDPGSVGGNDMTQEKILTQAADVLSTLQRQFDDAAPSVDNLLMMPMSNRQVMDVLDGSNSDMPQLDLTNAKNDHLRAFVLGLDNFAVQATRLDSRNDSSGTIGKYESAMMQGLLSDLWTICQVFGGQARRVDTPAGVMPNDEPNTFMAGPTFIQPAVSKVTGA